MQRRAPLHGMIDLVSGRLTMCERMGLYPPETRDEAYHEALIMWNRGRSLDEIAHRLDEMVPLLRRV